MSALHDKFKEVLMSVLPITLLVLLLNFTLCPMETSQIVAFLIGSFLVLIGLTIFLLGIDLGLEPIGHAAANAIAKSNRYLIVISVSLTLGFFVSFAEPDLHVLATQVDQLTGGSIHRLLMVSAVSAGLGLMMTLGLLRILHNTPLKYLFTLAYGLIFILSLFSDPFYQAIAFDASGATTGAITVPFMLALAAGISSMKKDSRQGEADAFGVIGLSSTGAIMGVLLCGFFIKDHVMGDFIPDFASAGTSGIHAYAEEFPRLALESLITFLPIIVTFIGLQIFAERGTKEARLDTIRGMFLTYLGLLLFMSGVNGGFMSVGREVGMKLAALNSSFPILIIAFLLGVSTVLAEPAVHVLTDRVEEATGGAIRRRIVLIFLATAVGLAIFLSVLRILVPSLQLWMYILPGFGLAVILSHLVPDIFVGMAIDAGGVASGPITATFSLAFIQGAATQIPTANILTDGFGMIAIVAMTPIIAIEIFGLLYKIQIRKRGIEEL